MQLPCLMKIRFAMLTQLQLPCSMEILFAMLTRMQFPCSMKCSCHGLMHCTSIAHDGMRMPMSIEKCYGVAISTEMQLACLLKMQLSCLLKCNCHCLLNCSCHCLIKCSCHVLCNVLPLRMLVWK